MSKNVPETEIHLLAEQARNILAWQGTGRLPDGCALEKRAETIRGATNLEVGERLRQAEHETSREALKFVIKYVDEIEANLTVEPAPAGYEGSPAHLAYELRTSIALMASTAKVRPDIWQRHVVAALRAAGLLEKSPNPTQAPEEADSAGPKTDQQIVDEVNSLAAVIARQHGYEAGEGYLFYISRNPRGQTYWQHAVEAYELITGSEVHDALSAVLPEEAEA